MEATIAQGDGTFFTESFDLKAVVQKASTGLDTAPAFDQKFLEGMTTSMMLGQSIVENIASYDGTYEFLQMMPGRPKRAFFRLAGDDGLDYHELSLRNDAHGTVRIIDTLI